MNARARRLAAIWVAGGLALSGPWIGAWTAPLQVGSDPAQATPAPTRLTTGRTVRLDVMGRLADPGSISGEAQAVAVSGDRGHLGVGPRLHVLDVSTPYEPILLGMTDPLSGTVLSVAVAGEHAYAAVGGGGLQVVSVALPDRPTPVARVDVPGAAVGVALAGSTAVVAAGPGGLRLFDVADPTRPRPVGVLDGLGTVHAVTVADGRAFVGASGGPAAAGAGGHRVVVVDIADPSAPAVVAEAAVPGEPHALTVGPKGLYVGDDAGGVSIFQSGTDGALILRGRFEGVGRPRGIAFVGIVVVVASEGGTLALVDVTNPARPTLSDIESTAGRPQGLSVAGRYAYVANGAQGMWVVPLTAGGTYGTYRTWSSEAGLEGLGVASMANHAYYGNGGSGLIAVNVANPGVPQMTRILSEQGYISGVAAGGGVLVAASQEGGVAAYDASASPGFPTRIGGVNIPPEASGVAIAGGRAYVGGGPDGLFLFDVSRRALVPAGGLRLAGWCAGVSVGEIADRSRHAYVAAGTSGVHIVDVTDGRAPRRVSTIDTPGMAMDTAVLEGAGPGGGRVLVVADGARGVRTIDVSDPAAPRDLGFYPVRGDSWDVEVADGLIFVAANKGGLRVLDVADPALPTLAGRLAGEDAIRGVTVAGSYAYVVGAGPGLAVVRVTVDDGTSATATATAGTGTAGALGTVSVTATPTPGATGTGPTPSGTGATPGGTGTTPGTTPDPTAGPTGTWTPHVPTPTVSGSAISTPGATAVTHRATIWLPLATSR